MVDSRTKKPLSLKEAAWQLSPSAMRTRARASAAHNRQEADQPRPVPTFLSNITTPDGGPAEGLKQQFLEWDNLVRGLQGALLGQMDPKEPSAEMRKWLIQELAKGSLSASGILTGSDPEIKRVTIPPELFQAKRKIDWQSSGLSSLGRAFEIVEVSRGPVTQNHNPPKVPRRPGRPTVHEQVRQVIAQLHNVGAFKSLSKKARFNLIKGECQKQFPNQFRKSGTPSDNTIDPHYRDIVEAAPNASKTSKT